MEAEPTPTGGAAGPPPLPNPPRPSQPWGFWNVIGAMLLMGVIFVAVTSATTFALVKLTGDGKSPAELFNTAGFQAAIFGVSLLTTVLLCWRFAERRKPGEAWSFLGFNPVPIRIVAAWTGAGLLLCLAVDGLMWLLGRPIVPQVVQEDYLGAESRLLLLFVVCVIAPLMEEMLMRGYFLESLRFTRARVAGAILLSAALWAGMHLQYDFYGILTIAAMGLILGFSRIHTGSIYPALAIHALNNVYASVEVILVTRGSA